MAGFAALVRAGRVGQVEHLRDLRREISCVGEPSEFGKIRGVGTHPDVVAAEFVARPRVGDRGDRAAVARHVQRGRIVARRDQLAEAGRVGDVGAFPRIRSTSCYMAVG